MTAMNQHPQPSSNKKKKRRKAATFIDGKDHINIWAKGDTELGRMLAYFADTPFVHPYFGPFNSMEGLWHWLRSKDKPDELRRLVGIRAKTFGKALVTTEVEGFFEIIHVANYYKIVQNPTLEKLLKNSTLPFEHYYLWGPGKVLIRPQGYEWVIKSFEELRKMIREGREPDEPDYSKIIKRK